ncbi:MAG: hypothetical protein ACYDHM_02240 [Acidiferrobacterales bacterium]
MSVAHSVWIPLASSLIGAIVGAGIGSWAVFHNSRKEEGKRREQAVRALLVEMYANALRLGGAAQALMINTSAVSPNYLQGRKYDEAYRTHLSAGVADAGWKDIENIVQAYTYAETVIDGPLSMDAWKRNPAEFPLKGTSAESFAKIYAIGAGKFCDTIRSLENQVPMNKAFNEAVKKVESEISHVL